MSLALSTHQMTRREDELREQCCPVYSFKLFSWQEERPQTPLTGHRIPKARSGHKIVYYNGCIYSFGGYNPSVLHDDRDLANDPYWKLSKPLFKELWRFNIHSKKWKKLDMAKSIQVPDQLASHSTVVVKDKMLLYGGTGAPFGLTTSNDVFVMDLQMFAWEVVDTTAENADNFPVPVYGQAVIVHEGNFYTVGGTSGFNYFMDVHRLNLATKTWECVFRAKGNQEEPAPRYRHELCVHKNHIFVLGGGTSFGCNDFKRLPGFDLETHKWIWMKTQPDPTIPIDESLSEQYPTARRCHSSVQCGEYAYLFGGYDGEKIFPGAWRLNLDTMTWKKLPYDVPTPVYFHASTITNSGKVFTFGGVSHVENNTRINTVYSAWVKIPSLRDMCWEALNHYSKNMDARNVESLMLEGIPRDLINSLYGLPAHEAP